MKIGSTVLQRSEALASVFLSWPFEIYLAAIWATLVGRDGPAEAKIFSYQGIQMSWIKSIAASDWRRRNLRPSQAMSTIAYVTIFHRQI